MGRVQFSWATLWSYTGPGWLMSMAYVDPGNLESDLQSGAYTNFDLLGVLLLSTVAGYVLQVLSSRLGTCTGRHLAQVCADEYPRSVSLVLWVLTEVAIIGSDIQEVLGSAIAFNLLTNMPLWVGCLVTALDTFTFLSLHAIGMRYLEAFYSVLVATMSLCFFADFGMGSPDWPAFVHGLVPTITTHNALQAVGTLGAVIMPHNLFLHSALVLSRPIQRHDVVQVAQANYYFRIETGVALAVSFCINAAVVGVFADSFFSTTCGTVSVQTACLPPATALFSDYPIYDFITNTECVVVNHTVQAECPRCRMGRTGAWGYCQPIGLAGAGDAIHDTLGPAAKLVRLVWAIGLLASGQASTMTGTYAGQFVMQGFVKLRLTAWKRVAVTRAIALVPAVVVAVSSQRSRTASDAFNEWLNVLQSVILPFALVPLLTFTSLEGIMGPHFVNSRWIRYAAITLTTFVLGVNAFLVASTVASTLTSFSLTMYSVLVLVGVAYMGFLLYLAAVAPWKLQARYRALAQKAATERLLSRDEHITETYDDTT
ncbi:Aste57867_867 [Aphanomyces stellatus]|uniref:Aste57867_867 protein n=1 Tax=Aphanomyces stellatus TaxID=120398 RepID=A0A485K6Z9_9STRA|nr:hypothetical protein As57867_000866 [Aphanomyces stellatus]VFT78091.1 Aste57867_867 [Aphanomyces stellatus]